ncbi:hypothetical protein HWV62_43654 [Athelia sp. TMB]|nr:hypothetical protein HWV62_43654 [Athelia sp. TMB]
MLGKIKSHLHSRSSSPAPNSQSFALEAARSICSTISSLGSGGLNVPGLQAVGDIGCKIIDTVQQMKDNQDACRTLIDHIANLMTSIRSVIGECTSAGIAGADVDIGLKADLERLNRCLEQVNQILQDLTGGSQVRKLFSSAGNAGRITECKEMIDREGTAFSDTPPAQPVPPKIFYGRDELVSELAALCSSGKQQSVAILGAGGLGKTSIALHVLHDPQVIKFYSKNIFFVACDGVTTVHALASRILRIMRAPSPPDTHPVDVLRSFLSVSSQTLLLLDNFESIWDLEQEHSAARGLLETVDNATTASFIITMRADRPPPISGFQWTWSQTIPTLSLESARKLFLTFNPTFCSTSFDYETLDKLLKELDHVPLAIHLLARVSSNSSPESSLKLWQEKRTQMLSLGQFTKDRFESVDVSIALSLNSLDIARYPEAIQLLGMLCLLPDGLLQWRGRLNTIWKTSGITNLDLQRLQQFALVYTSGDKLGVLSPIRHFILQHYPPDAEHAQCISNIYWGLVDTYARVNFGPEYNDSVNALNPELGNISNLIDHAVQCCPTERILHVTIDMSWYLYCTFPSTDMLDKVTRMVSTATPTVQALFWEISGEIAYKQDRYTEATSSFTQARTHFLDTGNYLKAAHCSYMLGDILRMRDEYPAATAMLTQARDQFLAFDDPAGLGRCLNSLGDVLYIQAKLPEASAILTEARGEFLKIGEHLGATQCLQSLGEVLYMQLKYSEASIMLTEARDEFLAMGEGVGAAQCLRTLGQTLQGKQKYEEASVVLKAAQAEFLNIGDRLGVAQCLRSLGQVLSAQKNYSYASSTLIEALHQFQDIGYRYGEAECSESLGDNVLAQGQRTEGESLLARARDLFLEIGLEHPAARCSRKIMDVDGSKDDNPESGGDEIESSAEQPETERKDPEIGGGDDHE